MATARLRTSFTTVWTFMSMVSAFGCGNTSPLKTEYVNARLKTQADDESLRDAKRTDARSEYDQGRLAHYLLDVNEARDLTYNRNFFKASENVRNRYIKRPEVAKTRSISTAIQKFSERSSALFRGDNKASYLAKIVNAPNYNAIAQYELLTFHLRTLLAPDNVALLATLCHEIAHSLIGHSHFDATVAMKSLKSNPDFLDLEKMIEDYVSKTVDSQTNEYRHHATMYAQLMQQADVAFKDHSVYLRRGESEADILGAKVCGAAGLSVSDFQRGQQLPRSWYPSLARPFSAKDPFNHNERVQLDADEDAFWFVYDSLPINSHPTAEERAEQLERVASVIPVSNEKLAKEFLTESALLIKELREQLPQNFSLVSGETHQHSLSCRRHPPFPGRKRPN